MGLTQWNLNKQNAGIKLVGLFLCLGSERNPGIEINLCDISGSELYIIVLQEAESGGLKGTGPG